MHLPRPAREMIWMLCLVSLGATPLVNAAAQYPNGSTFAPNVGGQTVRCFDDYSRPVLFIPDSRITDVGIARQGNPPYVVMNPARLSQLPVGIQLFWFGHECAHHVLGHINSGRGSESNADCWSIAALRDQFGMRREDIQAFVPYFRNFPGSRWGHLPGPARLANFARCYDRHPRVY